MNWLKKIFNKKVDERQEMDLLRVVFTGVACSAGL